MDLLSSPILTIFKHRVISATRDWIPFFMHKNCILNFKPTFCTGTRFDFSNLDLHCVLLKIHIVKTRCKQLILASRYLATFLQNEQVMFFFLREMMSFDFFKGYCVVLLLTSNKLLSTFSREKYKRQFHALAIKCISKFNNDSKIISRENIKNASTLNIIYNRYWIFYFIQGLYFTS